jgi:hypothetical protein
MNTFSRVAPALKFQGIQGIYEKSTNEFGTEGKEFLPDRRKAQSKGDRSAADLLSLTKFALEPLVWIEAAGRQFSAKWQLDIPTQCRSTSRGGRRTGRPGPRRAGLRLPASETCPGQRTASGN